MEPDHSWNGDQELELPILGWSNLYYAKYPETRKSVSGTSTFLFGVPIIHNIIVALSVTEGELITVTSNSQDMMFLKRLLELIGL